MHTGVQVDKPYPKLHNGQWLRGGGGEMIKSVGWGEVHESAALTRHLPIVSVRVTPDSPHHTHGSDKRGLGYFSTTF